jgi:AcrR family transcriptional regulator
MESVRPLGRREQKKNRTREDLVAAATRLFATRGFDETTTEDIAEAADVSQRTFFRHFPSKEAVLYGDMDDLRVRVREALDGRPAREPALIAVREAILTLADDHEDHKQVRLLQARLAASYPSVSAYSRAVVQAAWEKEIIEALAERLGVDAVADPRPEIIAGAAMSALRASIRRWVQSRGHEDLAAIVADALDTLRELPAAVA